MTKNLIVKKYSEKIKEQMLLTVFVFSDKLEFFFKRTIKIGD
jgi:hypothetical protein